MIDPKKDANSGLPVAEYLFEIINVRHIKSPRKKTPGILFTMEVLKGSKQGKKHKEVFYISDSAISMLARFALNCGIKEPFEETDINDVWDKFAGKRVKGKIHIEEYNDVKRSKLKSTDKLKKEEIANLDAIPRVAPIDLPENNNAEMSPNDNRGGGDESYEDDDIPF